MLILEKASGRTLYRNNNLPNTGGSHLLVSASKSQTAGQSPEGEIADDGIADDGQPNNDQAKDRQAEEKSARQAEARSSDDPPGTAPISPTEKGAPTEKRTSHEVTIEMTAKIIHLKFTDAPRPPLPPAMAEVEAGSPTGSKGIFGIIKKLGAGG